MDLNLEGLTDPQKKAIEKIAKRTTGRFFTGISIGTCIEDFRKINQERTTNPKAQETEKALFALCGYTEP